MNRTITGRMMAGILVGFFGVVIVVNIAMARLASSTFGGVVVENSYVASEHFNHWLAQASAAKALGWQAHTVRQPDGRVAVRLAGVPAGARLSALARHPLGRLPDRPLAFAATGPGTFLSAEALPAGRWDLRIDVQSAGHGWRSEAVLR